MSPERWKELSAEIRSRFSIRDEGEERIEEEGGIDISFIEFQGPMGLMRLEFVSKPLVLDKKTNYSKRIGSETGVAYVYSETEMNQNLNAYRWDDLIGDWQEIDARQFS